MCVTDYCSVCNGPCVLFDNAPIPGGLKVPSPLDSLFPPTRNKKKNMETTMRCDSATAAVNLAVMAQDPQKSEADIQRKYLRDRLNSIENDVNEKLDLYTKFKLNTIRPKTVEEAKSRIAEGRFTINGYGKDNKLFDSICWRAADELPDHDGMDLAREEFRAAKQKVLDTIAIQSPADGLAAVQEFANFQSTVEYDAERARAYATKYGENGF